MAGKAGWFQSVTKVGLQWCELERLSEQLAELRSMPPLRTLLNLLAICAERAADAEALYGLSELTALSISRWREVDEDGEYVEEEREWVLILSRDSGGAARSVQPHCLHQPQPLRLRRGRDGRGAARI